MIAYWHHDIELGQVRGVSYIDNSTAGDGRPARIRRTARLASAAQAEAIPELDLLEATLERRGVAQLEVSRGCTNYCSFCPRGHKGTWVDLQSNRLVWIIHEMSKVFDRYPNTSRTLYLVDEEFVGRGPDAVERALTIGSTLASTRFQWETSCRIDQVVAVDRDLDWHYRRASMWRDLVAKGLRRCLFGVESGVTSILHRFNKETDGEQN